MNAPLRALAKLAVTLTVLDALGCETSPSSPDAAPATDAQELTPDAGADAGPPLPACELAAPLVAGTAETDAIADAPARCGATSYAWLRSDRLGEVVSRTPSARFDARALEVLAGSAGAVFLRPLEHHVQLDTVVYTTQDRGALVESSTLLAYPDDLSERARLPVLLLLHGTSGGRSGCGATTDPIMRALAGALASLGFVVVAPDYLGLESAGEPYGALHPYLVPEPTALASLDAVRAGVRALSALRLPTCAGTDLVVYGISQGGHAALFVERYAPYYARELRVRGVAAAVPASDMVAHASRALTTHVEMTDFIVSMLGGASPWYGLDDRLGEALLPPHDAEVSAALAAACEPALPPSEPLSGLFTPALLAGAATDLAAVAPFGCVLAEASLATSSVPRLAPTDPSYGILVELGSDDVLVDPGVERVSYDALCAAGLPLAYLECEGLGHADAAIRSMGEAVEFLDARLAGEPFAPVCSRPAAARCSGTP